VIEVEGFSISLNEKPYISSYRMASTEMEKFIKNTNLYYYDPDTKKKVLIIYTVLIVIALCFMVFTNANQFLISSILLFLAISVVFILVVNAEDF